MIAEALGLVVDVDPDIPEELMEGHCSSWRPVLWIRPAKTEQATHFRVCHEIGHFHLERQLSGRILEQSCDRFAAALLMPPEPFRAKALELGANPYELRKLWCHCSLESIARRITELLPNYVASAWDWYARRWFQPSDELSVPAEANEATHRALFAAYGSPGGFAVHHDGDLKVAAWRTQAWPHRAIALCELR